MSGEQEAEEVEKLNVDNTIKKLIRPDSATRRAQKEYAIRAVD